MKKISSFLLMLFCVFVLKADNTPNTFTEDEILDSMKQKIKPVKIIGKQDEKKLKTIAEKLKNYKITGFSFCIDPNFAFFWDTQNPEIQVTYKNSQGEVKTRNYESKIKSIGLKLELDFKFDFIFFTDTDVNFYDSNKKIKLGSGFDLSSNLVAFTYVSFKNMPGGLIIIGFPILKAINLLATYAKYHQEASPLEWLTYALFPMPSYVSGGKLKPVR